MRQSDCPRLSKRRILQLTGSAVVVGLAGCVGNGDDDSGDDEPADDSVDDESADDEPADGDPGDDDPADGEPTLQDVLRWEPSYIMELVVPLGSGTITVNNGNTYTDWTVNGVRSEVYRVDGDEYIVVDGMCFIPVGSSEGEIFEPERLRAEYGDMVAVDADPIDGEAMYRFDVDDGSLYVNTESGYPRRFESDEDGSVIDFHSWGETDPISPPDMDCIEQ